jgi:hypothetical protein
MSTPGVPPFHLAIPVRDLASSRRFYGGVLECPEGRSAERWVDFDFFGHQLVCHVSDGLASPQKGAAAAGGSSPVDGHDVPIPHFGVVLEIEAWERLARRLEQLGTRFVIEPHVRFPDQPGEQRTMFFLDPSGNAVEVKAFRDIGKQLFEK